MHDYAPTKDSSGGRIEAEYTEHREPLEQGGYRYVRCEGCGRELLCCLGGREKLVHKEDCPNARGDRR